MQFEGNRRSSHVPNLTALIDIVFLLLIFFMLTSHFVRDESISLDLPQAETGDSFDTDKSIEIIIHANGDFEYNGQPYNADSLQARLTQELRHVRDRQIRIKGDRAAELGATVMVLDIARKAGATGVDIVTERK